jgi:hypothetical protein
MIGSPHTQRILHLLHKVKRSGDGWVAVCPAHEDRSPSLSITEGRDGRVLLNCHAGCQPSAIVAALGLTMAHLFAEPVAAGLPAYRPPPASSGTNTAIARAPDPAADAEPDDDPAGWPVVKVYDYTSADGALVYEVQRKEPAAQLVGAKRRKTFRARRPDGAGGWTYSLAELTERPLYHLPDVLEAIAAERTIILTEGEKDCDRVIAAGLQATTHSGGAKGWRSEYARQLAGADVVLLPDDDTPGREWAAIAAAALVDAGARVRICAVPVTGPLGQGNDVSDYLDAGGTALQLEAMIARAPQWTPGTPIPEPPSPSRFTVLTDSQVESLPPLRYLVDGMLPVGALAAIWAPPAAWKSFLMLDLLCSVATGVPFLGRPTVQGGALYVLAEGSSGMGQRVRAWKDAHRRTGESLGVGFVMEPPDLMGDMDSEHIVRAAATLPRPCSLVVIDTLHLSMPGGEENSARDLGLVLARVKRIQRATGAAVILVHHSKKDGDSERGSSSLKGAVDTMLSIRVEDDRRTLICEKQKDAAPFESIPLAIVPTLDSCVVIEAAPDADSSATLTPQKRAALECLARDFLADGATTTQWLKASGVPERSFYRARADLVTHGYVLSEKRGMSAYHILTQRGREVCFQAVGAVTTANCQVLPSILPDSAATPSARTGSVRPPLGGPTAPPPGRVAGEPQRRSGYSPPPPRGSTPDDWRDR